MFITTTFLIAISLSLDAFSLSLSYGLFNFSNKKILLVSIIVGIFHFFMPIFGFLIGEKVFNIIKIDPKYIISIIFIIIILSMIKSIKEETDETKMNFVDMILFAFAVSLDSFSVGIALSFLNTNLLLSAFIFMCVSFIFTFSGFKLGKYFSDRIGEISKIIGIILLSFLTIFFLIN